MVILFMIVPINWTYFYLKEKNLFYESKITLNISQSANTVEPVVKMANMVEHIYLLREEEENVRLLSTIINILLSLQLSLPTTAAIAICNFFRY